jgi:hypothetical protein
MKTSPMNLRLREDGTTMLYDVSVMEEMEKEFPEESAFGLSSDEIVFGAGRTANVYGSGHAARSMGPLDLDGKEIDKVDASHVARVKRKHIERLASLSPSCCQKGLNLLLVNENFSPEDGDPESNFFRNKNEIQKARTRLGQPKFRVSGTMKDALLELQKESNLYETLAKNVNTKAYCNGFFVVKSENLLRIICDARPANAIFDHDKYTYSLFTVETLGNVVSNLSQSCQEDDSAW